jgi:hypothetical protein
MYRLALLALLIVLPVGCGGGSDNDDSEPSSPATAQTQPEHSDEGKPSRSERKPKKADEREGADKREEEAGQTVEEAYEGRDAETQQLIRAAVRGTLELFGLGYAGVEVDGRGDKVTALVTRATACDAVAKNEPVMAARIQKAAPMVKAVRFEVAGTGQELGYYILDCKQEPMPDGPGKAVYERTAVGGPVVTKTITLRGRRWAIEWENIGSSFTLIVVGKGKSEGNYYDPISSDKRETGRKTFKGPGTVELHVSGSGRWTARVKDIR